MEYKRENGETYDFGIRRISVEEQKQYLLSAAVRERFDNSSHNRSHAIYDKPKKTGVVVRRVAPKENRPYGYCKSTVCRKERKWAAPFGSCVGYNCIDCLAKFICDSRAKLKGANVKIVIRRTGEYVKSNLEEPIQIEFKPCRVIINKTEPVEYQVIEIEKQLVYVVDDIPRCLEKTMEYDTIYNACIIGRNVCENIIFGKECLSIKEDYVPECFLAKSVPPGVPGWKEEKDNVNAVQRGKISIPRYCHPCAIAYMNDKNSWSKSASPKKEKSNTEENYWKKKYSELMMENTMLKMEIADLQAKLTT